MMSSGGGAPEANGNNNQDNRNEQLRQARLRMVRQGKHLRRRSRGLSAYGNPRGPGFVTRFFAVIVGLLMITGVGFGGVAISGYVYFTRDLPSPETLAERKTFQSINIYDRNHQLLASLWNREDGGRRDWVSLSEISPWAIKATIAAEDPRFYDNMGVDPISTIRALVQNYTQGGITSGASTLTQQLARNAFMDAEERQSVSYLRKIREAILALQITNTYTKDEILEMYLNTVYYGNLSYSIQTASEAYFNKPAKDLTLPEAALLAGLPQSPSAYDPFTNPTDARSRQLWVLDAMVQHGFLSREEADAAKQEQVVLQRKQYDFLAPHFINYVSGLLWEKYGPDVYNLGLEVQTTLDYNQQKLGEEIVKQHVSTIRNLDASNGALVAIDPHRGEILAMVGSADYNDDSIDGQVNMTIAERQPGSTLKPFTYLTAFLEKGATPSTVLLDRQTLFDVGYGNIYAPGNHDGGFHGAVSIRRALASSLNIPAVVTMDYVSLDSVLNILHKFGITTLNDRERYGLAITLGGGEVTLLDLTYAYAVFANGGTQVGEEVPLERRRLGYSELQPTPFLRITDSRGNILYDYVPKTRQLIDPQEAYLITSIISDNEAQEPTYGPNNELLMPRPAAAKTGTTEWYQDSWTIGYTPDLAVGAWVGNADNHPMKRVVGASGAGMIWNTFTQESLKGTPCKEFIVPPGLERAETWTSDPLTGKWQLRRDWFLPGQNPALQPAGEKSGYYLRVTTGRNEFNMPVQEYRLENVPQFFREGAEYWTTDDLPKETPDPNRKPFTPYWDQIVNTGGQGAYLRFSPNPDDKMELLPEGTRVQVIDHDKVVRKTTWRHVRDEQGHEGWIPAYWLSIQPEEEAGQ